MPGWRLDKLIHSKITQECGPYWLGAEGGQVQEGISSFSVERQIYCQVGEIHRNVNCGNLK